MSAPTSFYRDIPSGVQPSCVGEDPEIFWNPSSDETFAYAKSICNSCPIMDSCLKIGINRKEWGVYGGKLLRKGHVSGRFRFRKEWVDVWESYPPATRHNVDDL